jgi:hypothetical protein
VTTGIDRLKRRVAVRWQTEGSSQLTMVDEYLSIKGGAGLYEASSLKAQRDADFHT